MMKNEIYMNTAVYAREHGERDQYFQSRRENEKCKREIEKAISENFDGCTLNEDGAKQIIEQFGIERVEYVLAATVQQLDWDGRFSKANKEWAKEIETVEDMVNGWDIRRDYTVSSHPAVVNGFINQVRKEMDAVENTASV